MAVRKSAVAVGGGHCAGQAAKVRTLYDGKPKLPCRKQTRLEVRVVYHIWLGTTSVTACCSLSRAICRFSSLCRVSGNAGGSVVRTTQNNLRKAEL